MESRYMSFGFVLHYIIIIYLGKPSFTRCIIAMNNIYDFLAHIKMATISTSDRTHTTEQTQEQIKI